MKQVNIHEAKTQLSKLIAAAERGEEVIIARAGKPAVKIVPAKPKKKTKDLKRVGGFMKGQIWIGPDFDDPLPPDIQRVFDGDGD